MNKLQKFALFFLRITLGVLFFYAGVTKVLDPQWSAAGFLQGAKTFPGLYHWFASAGNIGWVNFINEWGLTLIGAFLLAGFLVRWVSLASIVLMALYYFPVLQFPYIPPHAFLVDEHIIYLFSFLVLYSFSSRRTWSLDALLSKRREG